MALSPGHPPKPTQPRWYAPTPAKFLFTVLAMQAILFLSAHYRWFWFNELKGYTVLITVSATAIALFVFAGLIVVSRFFKAKSQFGLATLLWMIAVMGIPCAWLAREMELARRQTAIVEFVKSRSGRVVYSKTSRVPGSRMIRPSLEEVRPVSTLGSEFFSDVSIVILYQAEEQDFERLKGLPALFGVRLYGPQMTHDHLEYLQKLSQITFVELNQTPVTDAGLMHLRKLRELQRLTLHRTRVSEQGLKDFYEAMPKCRVEYTNRPGP